jgi:hypothetical protein
MQESHVTYELPKRDGSYRELISALEDVGYTVDIHHREGRWPDIVSTAQGKLAGRIDNPFCIVAELNQPGGVELRNFMGNYKPETGKNGNHEKK